MLRDCKVDFGGREMLEFEASDKVFEGWINGFGGWIISGGG